MPSILALVSEGFEEIEFVTPVDLMRRAEFKVTTAAVGRILTVKGRSGIILTADALLQETATGDFDAVFIPGGPGVRLLRQDPLVLETVQGFARRGAWILAICAAPLVLKDAGLLSGRRYTAHTSALPELPEAIKDQSVVVDGTLVTSRGAGTALPFGLQILACLGSEALSKQVADSICAPG